MAIPEPYMSAIASGALPSMMKIKFIHLKEIHIRILEFSCMILINS